MRDSEATVSVRRICGDIFAELDHLRYEGHISLEAENAIIDIALGVVARWIGFEISQDEGYPVEPLPRKSGELT